MLSVSLEQPLDKVSELKDDLDHDEDDDEPLEPHVVLVREVLADEAHQL